MVLDYLVKNGSQRVVQQCKDNMFSIETLKDFQFIDKEGKDQGTLSKCSCCVFVLLIFIMLVNSHSTR